MTEANITQSLSVMLDTMSAEMKVIQDAYQQKLQSIFKQVFKQYFQENPEVTCFGWRQYTPYFNDGEECEFCCYVEYGFATNAVDYSAVKYGEYYGDEDVDKVWISDDDYGNFNVETIPASVEKNTKILRETLSKIDDKMFLVIFGDHCNVFATPKGFDVQEYDHD